MKKTKRMRAALCGCAEDLLILGGLFCIALAFFLYSLPLGLAALGIELLGLGVWTARHPPSGGPR